MYPRAGDPLLGLENIEMDGVGALAVAPWDMVSVSVRGFANGDAEGSATPRCGYLTGRWDSLFTEKLRSRMVACGVYGWRAGELNGSSWLAGALGFGPHCFLWQCAWYAYLQIGNVNI